MTAIVFDGQEAAAKIEAELKERIADLKKKPRLAIVLDNETQASQPIRLASNKYVQMKQEAALRVGIEVEVFKKLNEVKQSEFDGVMVQLPSSEDLSQIERDKDVDGLNPKSDSADSTDRFVPATIKAVEKVLDQALLLTEADVDDNLKIAIVGAKGNVGRPLMERMQRYGMNVTGFDKEDLPAGRQGELNLKGFKVIVSCTGQAGLIKKEMVDMGVILIDVGFPKGDFEESVREKASFMTPVPKGVGPITVVSLLSNVVQSAENF